MIRRQIESMSKHISSQEFARSHSDISRSSTRRLNVIILYCTQLAINRGWHIQSTQIVFRWCAPVSPFGDLTRSRDLTNSQHLPFISAIFAGVFLLVGFRKSVSVNLVAFEACFRRHDTWDLTNSCAAQNSQRLPCVSTHSCSNVLVHEH
jgi:hypothetical protein